MFDDEDHNNSSPEMSEPHPSPTASLSPYPKSHKFPTPGFPAFEDTTSLLFKLELKIYPLIKTNTYKIFFLTLPDMEIPTKGKVSIIFPMSADDLDSFVSPSLDITASEKNEYICNGSINVSKQLKSLHKKIECPSAEFPVSISREEVVTLISQDGNSVSKVQVNFTISCLGLTMVEDVVEKPVKTLSEKTVIPSSPPMKTTKPEPQPQPQPEPEPDYDEYCAEINGHSLNIRMLRKKKDKLEEPASCSSNSKASNRKKQKQSSPVPSGGVGRKNSQIIFQMPSNQALCTKSPPNAVMYNVGTCQQGEKHDHGPEKIKVLPGNTDPGAGDKSDCFVIKLGKKGKEDGRGRLELELKAPKPKGPEDFRKPSRDADTQTDATEKPKATKGGKKKKV